MNSIDSLYEPFFDTFDRSGGFTYPNSLLTDAIDFYLDCLMLFSEDTHGILFHE